MNTPVIIGKLTDDSVEIVERKGLGHPDTICDEIVDLVSKGLCRYYLDHFGAIMHHNVDKALLIGGQSQPIYGGGVVLKPIELIITGRATHKVGDVKVPINDITQTAAREYCQQIRYLDALKHLEVVCKIRPGSADLVELFQRFSQGEMPLSNDTSFGTGYYPLSNLEQHVMAIEKLLNHQDTKNQYPFVGEDIKVMGIRQGQNQQFTVSIAMIDRNLNSLEQYIFGINRVKHLIQETCAIPKASIAINTADNYDQGSVYLTVTGTSAEQGDDGQVGRGNRLNGLITPYRPMSLEATAGKNPVSHVGKIYNYFAMDLCKNLVNAGLSTAAQAVIVSQIGKPINEPQCIHLRLQDRSKDEKQIKELVTTALQQMDKYAYKIIGIAPKEIN